MKKVVPVVGLLPIACSRFRGMGKETPALYEDRIQRRLDDIQRKCEGFALVVNPGQIYAKEDVEKAISLFFEKKVDCVFAFFLSWSEDASWIRFLRDMFPLPLFYAHVRPEIHYTNTEKEDDFIEYLSTGGLVGALEGSGAFKRFSRPMSFTGCGDINHVLEEVQPFALASAVRRELRNSSFALIGGYPEIMWSTYCDPFSYFSTVGPVLHFIQIARLKEAYDAVSESRVDGCVSSLLEQYKTRGEIEMEHFRASVRCSLAVEDVTRKAGAEMAVLNDGNPVLFEQIGLRPGFYPTPENHGDVAVVPEGDLGLGLSTYIALKLTGKHVNVIEPFYLENDGRVKCGHAGPNDYTDPEGSTIIGRDVRFARSGYKHAGAPFAWYVMPDSGVKTMVHCSQGKEGRYKLVATTCESVAMEHELASYTHGCICFPGRNPDEVFHALLQEGVTQHYALVDGDILKELGYLARILDFDYIEV